MNEEQIRSTVLRALAGVAPEIDVSAIDLEAALRDQYDLDSVDFLNFVVAIHAETGVDIPEADYPRLATVEGCVEYLATALGSGAR